MASETLPTCPECGCLYSHSSSCKSLGRTGIRLSREEAAAVVALSEHPDSASLRVLAVPAFRRLRAYVSSERS
jgi:hypothetical protein